MVKAVIINGSPRTDKGNTAYLLTSFMQGMKDAGAEIDVFYASRLHVDPCNCGHMLCWYKTPGVCYHKDSMLELYTALKQAPYLVLATPVYIPLPGDMQNILNRLCPLLLPYLDFHENRTRARFREDVKIKTIALIATSGWWEVENMDTVVRIAKEITADAGANYGGSLLRPHADMLKENGEITDRGKVVLAAAQTAGYELVADGVMHKETLALARQPLIEENALRAYFNSIA